MGCHGSHWRLSFSTARSWPAHWWPRQRACMSRFSGWPSIFLTSMLFFLLFSMMMVMLFFTWFPSFFYIFSCCCGCSRIGSSRSVPPKYSLERKKVVGKKIVLMRESFFSLLISPDTMIDCLKLTALQLLTPSIALYCIQKLLIRSWLYYVPMSYTNILTIRVRKGNM